MANLKELRGRIKSVSNIAQITGAMEMVASMKLRKVQGRAQANRPYTEEIRTMVEHLAEGAGGEDIDLPLFQERDLKTSAVFLITSDRGLCGSYNANVLSHFQQWHKATMAADPSRKIKIFCYGKKGYAFLTKRSYDVERYFAEPALDKADFSTARMVSQALVEAFEESNADEVKLIYTQFASAARFVPVAEGFLPVSGLGADTDGEPGSAYLRDYTLEPSAEAILNSLIPRYLETVIYDAMIQSLASEQASRRMAMKGATDAATDMSKSLKKIYNRARQESITKELLDIVGGANAVS